MPEVTTDPPTVVPVDIVNGCCMMVRADVFRRVGLIDDRFFLIHEEADFCLRVLRAGFRCGVLAEGLVWHKGSSTFKRSGKRVAAVLRHAQLRPAAVATPAVRVGAACWRRTRVTCATPTTATATSARRGTPTRPTRCWKG